VPDVVIDRRLVIPAVYSRRSKYRALLALLRYGRASLIARSASDLEHLGDEYAGAVFKGPSIEDVVARAEREKASFEEHVGHAPDDWRMIGSRPLFDSYYEAMRRFLPELGLAVTPAEISGLHKKLVLTASGVVPDDRVLPIVPHVHRRQVDIALHTALTGGGDFFVTGDERLIGSNVEDRERGAVVQVVTFESLADRISSSSFDLSLVSPTLW